MQVLRWMLLSLYLLLLVGLLLLPILDDDFLAFAILAAVNLVSIPLLLWGVGWKDLCIRVSRPRLIMPVIIAGAMAAVLFGGFFIAMAELFYLDDDPVGYIWLGATFLSWIGWSVLLYIHVKEMHRFKVLFRMTTYLFAGSLAELLATVPAHVIVTRRPGCLVGIGTMLGILAGIYVMVWTFGPGIALLFLRDRLKTERRIPTCFNCGYNLTGTIQAGLYTCPECGTEVAGGERERLAGIVNEGGRTGKA